MCLENAIRLVSFMRVYTCTLYMYMWRYIHVHVSAIAQDQVVTDVYITPRANLLKVFHFLSLSPCQSVLSLMGTLGQVVSSTIRF